MADPKVTPFCPSPSGTVGLALLEALQNDAIYGNVHTDRFPTGEIRGQFRDHGND